MLPELLVALACSSGKGCAETADQYRRQNPWVDQLASRTQDTLRPLAVNYWGPLAAFAAGRSGSVHLSRNVNLLVSQNETKVEFSVTF